MNLISRKNKARMKIQADNFQYPIKTSDIKLQN